VVDIAKTGAYFRQQLGSDNNIKKYQINQKNRGIAFSSQHINITMLYLY